MKTPNPPATGRLLRVLVIGAGSRGHAYAGAIAAHNWLPASSGRHIPAVVAGVAETDGFKREEFGRRFVWAGREGPGVGEAFEGWKEWVEWERGRRGRVQRGEAGKEEGMGVDAVFVCVLDEMHVEVVEGIKELGGVHIMCEKPLATTMEGCVRMWRAAQREKERDGEKVFGICHVLRYSPHNMMLRELVREKEVVGDIVSVEHTEPVGWWHFSHSYVRCVHSLLSQ
jgi:predicted dehydrogenase